MDHREFLQSASALGTVVAVPLPAIAAVAAEGLAECDARTAAAPMRGVRMKISPFAEACNRYFDGFGRVAPAYLSMEFPEAMLVEQIETALAEGRPVKGWKPLPTGVFV